MALLENGRPPRDTLPSIQHLDFDHSRPEKDEHSRFSIMSNLSISTAPLGSPTTVYSGPPPPYSCASSTTESAHGMSGYFSPPQPNSRRSTRDEKDLLSGRRLPSLPSLHEALGGDKSGSFPGSLSTGNPKAPGSTPTTATGLTFPDAPRGPPNPFSHPPPPSLSSGYVQADPQPAKTNNFSTGSSEHPRPPRPPQPYSSSPQTDNNLHRSSVGSISSISHPTSKTSNATPYVPESKPQHTAFADHPSQPPAPPSQPQTSFTFEAAGKFDDTRNPFVRRDPQPSYGDTVKRHLEVFDAELALHEISEHSNRTFEFSRSWAQRIHSGNRSSYIAESAPAMQDIDEMVRQQHRILEHMNRLREVVIMQQTALSEQQSRAARSYIDDDHQGLHDDHKTGGFSNGDAKKRRGKAAPPGRCHSCNRAETPEWRRGPDGARTLCNACGLHYAKLTRKLGVNKASTITGSNLRPKGPDPRPAHV